LEPLIFFILRDKTQRERKLDIFASSKFLTVQLHLIFIG